MLIQIYNIYSGFFFILSILSLQIPEEPYFSPAINVYNIVEAETILAGSGDQPGFGASIGGFENGGEEEIDAEPSN